ncbi:DedA family protein [Actinopolymorpha sp. B17G11]|uniref:DedA family protein n=1 Tax=Actinopolymorpha sp. B17G11 TaxID=3160861 RepID=UPI0032E529DF
MSAPILDVVHDAMNSPWIYLAVFVLATLDGFLPAFPSESVVIAAGAFAAAGAPNLWFLIVIAALGAFAGDHMSYLLGRVAGGPLLARTRPGSRRRRAFGWASAALHRRGGLVLVVARYVPGGRTATTLTMGTVGFPLRTFSRFDAVAAVSWATYSACVGYLGGLAFEREPIKGVLLGLGLAISVTVVVEAARHLVSHRARRVTLARQRKTLVAVRQGGVPEGGVPTADGAAQ